MTRTTALAAVLLALAASSVQAKERIEYDADAAFGSFATYTLMFETEKGQQTLVQRSPLMHQQIVESLTRHLAEAGLTQVEHDADLIVTYHVASGIDDSFVRLGRSGPSFGGGDWSYADTQVSAKYLGLLIIDIYDARADKIIWRGQGTSVPAGNPGKGAEKIEKSIDRLVDKWDKLRRNGEGS